MRRFLLTLILSGVFFAQGYAGVPGVMNLQGRVTDATGTPIDSTVDITFTLYTDEAGTTQIWQEVQADVSVADGRFNVLLGSVNPLTPVVLDGSVRWLSIKVGDGPESDDLIPLTSSAYAQRASHADTAAFVLSAASNGWVDAGTVLHPQTITDSVGIGTDDPSFPLEVVSPLVSIVGRTEGDNFLSMGLYGHSGLGGTGVMGQSRDGRGVYGSSANAFAGFFDGPKNYFSGNVGIGTTTPDEKLDIENNASGGTAFMKIESSHGSAWGEAGLRIETPENRWHLRMDDPAHGQIPDGALGLRSQDLGAEVMTWTSDGKVGIGTTAPAYDLDVVSASTALRGRSTGSGIGVYGMSATGYGGYFTGPKHYFNGNLGLGTTNPTHRLTIVGEAAFQSSGVTRFHMNYYNGGLNFAETSVADYRLNIEAGGYVGIGTGQPQEKLHVAGNTRIDGTLHADAFETDAISSGNILDEVGIASTGSATGQDLSVDYSAYLTRQITVPASGYVLALGFAALLADHGLTGSTWANVGISSVPDDMDGSRRSSFYLSMYAGSGSYYSTVPCQRVFQCPSAGTYTYYMVAQCGSGNDVRIVWRELDLLFIPTLYASTAAEDVSDFGEARARTRASGFTEATITRQVAEVPGTTARAGGNQLIGRIDTLMTEVQSLKARLEALEKK